ncbi:hypothetical protein FA10DRAFT_264036 [Acaromyces ingoldii]|uniref:Thioredoxin-like protein n=1 Tax=Acaromyces ingoldii TaxID=215250 RepID=A0A316YXL0_9BASI|nr:hypothetical protein FA10DRAFT_264036 [Acaromyces ingoldii]PWN93378.1 hypothetical protein FA10DRAFT_264036 [Acaromyces ingoldii]
MTAPSKPELLIELYTDPMCPWCLIHDARLEQTLNSSDFVEQIYPYLRPVVKFRPYILDPRLPATSTERPADRYDDLGSTEYTAHQPPTKRQYYSQKFGGGLDAFYSKIGKAAKDVGLPPFQWLTDGKVGATWDSHRLLWYAGTIDEQRDSSASSNGDATGKVYVPGVQAQLASRLYKAFHQDSLDLSDCDVLADIANDIEGLFKDKQEAKRWLQSDEGSAETGHLADLGVMNGVQSVPFTIIQDGSDHTSEVLDHKGLMKMFDMATALHK